MRIFLTLLCLITVSCNERRSSTSGQDLDITGADATWASDINVYKNNIGSLADWPVYAVGIVVIGHDGKVMKELRPTQSPVNEAFSPDTLIRLAVSQHDQEVKCRFGVGGVTSDMLLDSEFAPFGGWTGRCTPVDGIVLVTTDGDIISSDGVVMMNSKGKKLGFKLYRNRPE